MGVGAMLGVCIHGVHFLVVSDIQSGMSRLKSASLLHYKEDQ
jgi:hypothetical protein